LRAKSSSLAIAGLLFAFVCLRSVMSESLSATAGPTKEVSVEFAIDRLPWPGNEIIIGGHIIMHGCTVPETTNSVASLFTIVKNDPGAQTSTLTMSLFIRGRPYLNRKEQESAFQSWHCTIKSSNGLTTCPYAACPVTIEGDLMFVDGADYNINISTRKYTTRKVQLTSSNFVIAYIPKRTLKRTK